MLFGVNPMAGILLQALNIKPDDVPRFRDCYLDNNDGKPRIGLHTRTGGGNRNHYESAERAKANDPEGEHTGPWNSDLRKLPGYQYDEDDNFDCTYATFYYDVPPAFASIIETLREISGSTLNPADRWQKLLADLKSGEQNDTTIRALKVGEAIFEQLQKATP